MSAEPSAPGWFDLGRTRPFPAIYAASKTPVTVDVLEIGWVVAFFALLLSFYCILPAANNRVTRFVRVTLFLLLGLAIMLCNFGQEWEVGKVHTRTQYRAGTSEEIEADIGVKLGLRSVNITLKRTSTDVQSVLSGETINYNERFTWAWAQGRAGFGPFAGQIQRDYRAAQYRGLPYPILWIAEYFTFDGEGIRFGRYYRTSGWYAHICIWGAFPMWLLTLVMFKMVVKYAAASLTITGILMLIPAIIWAANRNFIELQIPFEDGVLTTHFGFHWYLSLIVGILCILVGLILYFLDDIYNEEICQFFGNNPLSILDEGVAEEEPEAPASNEHEMERLDVAPEAPRLVATFRGRGTSAWKKKQKSIILPPVIRSGKLTRFQDGMQLGYQDEHPSTSGFQHGVPNQGYMPESRHGGYGTAEQQQQQQQQGHRYPEDSNRQHPPTSGYLPSASNEGYEPDLRRGGYGNAGQQQGHRYPAPHPPPQSEIYDDLQNVDHEQTIYENIQPKLRASPNLPPKPKKF